MPFDLYVWQSPRDVDDARASALVREWEAAGADPALGPFEPRRDVGWFHRELVNDRTGLELVSDANPNPSTKPTWLSGGDDEPPARLVAIRITPEATADGLDDVFSLAAKYDLVVFDARSGRVHFPLKELGDVRGCHVLAVGRRPGRSRWRLRPRDCVIAWIIGIPILSGIVIVIGGFMFVMAVFTFIHAGRKALRERRSSGSSTPPD